MRLQGERTPAFAEQEHTGKMYRDSPHAPSAIPVQRTFAMRAMTTIIIITASTRTTPMAMSTLRVSAIAGGKMSYLKKFLPVPNSFPVSPPCIAPVRSRRSLTGILSESRRCGNDRPGKNCDDRYPCRTHAVFRQTATPVDFPWLIKKNPAWSKDCLLLSGKKQCCSIVDVAENRNSIIPTV